MNADEKMAQVLFEKATHDIRIVEIGLAHDAFLDTILFHLQQAAEKMIKAALCCRQVTYPHTHDLQELLALAAAQFPQLLPLQPSLVELTPHAVQFRYDSTVEPGREDVLAAFETVKQLSQVLHSFLPPHVWGQRAPVRPSGNDSVTED